MLIALIEELAILTAELLEGLMLAFVGVKPPRPSRRKRLTRAQRRVYRVHHPYDHRYVTAR